MKATLKRKEVPQLLKTMKSLTGILNVKKAISFGRDMKPVKEQIEEIESFELTKPARLTELQEKYDQLFKAKQMALKTGQVNEAELLFSWEHGQEFKTMFDTYRAGEHKFLNETVEINFKTIFESNDLYEVRTAELAFMLTYFIK